MSFKLDSICRAYFVAALDLAVQQYVKSKHSDEKTSRAALFVLANSFWGTFYAGTIADGSTGTLGKDDCFRAELKKLGPIMVTALEQVSSWKHLYDIVLAALRTWLFSLEDGEDSVSVYDLELREHALHFSEILFNACFAAGNPLREPAEVGAAVAQMRQQYAEWADQISS